MFLILLEVTTMKKKTLCFLWALIVWFCVNIGPASGALYSIVFDGPSNIAGNTNFSINVYLLESLGPSDSTVLGNPNKGIVSGNFQVEIVSGASTLVNLSGNLAFDLTSTDATTSPWTIEQADLDVGDGNPYGMITVSGEYRFVLGKIEGISFPGDEFRLRIIDFDATLDDIVLYDLDSPTGDLVLDDLVFPSSVYSLSVSSSNVVPEPSMSLIFGSAILMSCVRSYRKRNKS